MKAVLCAVTLDPCGDLSHYGSRECLVSFSLAVILRFPEAYLFDLILVDGVEVTLSGASLSGYATSQQEDTCSSTRRKDFCWWTQKKPIPRCQLSASEFLRSLL